MANDGPRMTPGDISQLLGDNLQSINELVRCGSGHFGLGDLQELLDTELIAMLGPDGPRVKRLVDLYYDYAEEVEACSFTKLNPETDRYEVILP